jgi:hypothetical protein
MIQGSSLGFLKSRIWLTFEVIETRLYVSVNAADAGVQLLAFLHKGALVRAQGRRLPTVVFINRNRFNPPTLQMPAAGAGVYFFRSTR